MVDTIFAFFHSFFAELKLHHYISILVPLSIVWITLRYNTKKEEKRYKLALHTKYKYYLILIKSYNDKIKLEIDHFYKLAVDMLDDRKMISKKNISSYFQTELYSMDKNTYFTYLDTVDEKKEFVEIFINLMQMINLTLDTRKFSEQLIESVVKTRDDTRRELDRCLDSLNDIFFEIQSDTTTFNPDCEFVTKLFVITERYSKSKDYGISRADEFKSILLIPINELCNQPLKLTNNQEKIKNRLFLVTIEAIHQIDQFYSTLNNLSLQLREYADTLRSSEDFIKKTLPFFERYLLPPYYAADKINIIGKIKRKIKSGLINRRIVKNGKSKRQEVS